jgi:hypothetical protein
MSDSDWCSQTSAALEQHAGLTMSSARGPDAKRQRVTGRFSSYQPHAVRKTNAEGEADPIAWVIDCMDHQVPPHKLTADGEVRDVWLLTMERDVGQHDLGGVGDVLFAAFRDAESGVRFFRIPKHYVRYRMVCVYDSWAGSRAWAEHLGGGPLEVHVDVPVQSSLKVAQDPHGSGKTYRLTEKLMRSVTDADGEFKAYSTFVVMAKLHTAKHQLYTAFMRHVKDAQLKHCEPLIKDGKKNVVEFVRADGSEVTHIFSTFDANLWNLTKDKDNKSSDVFLNLVRTISKYGPTKLQGPEGRYNMAQRSLSCSKRTLFVLDEATLIPGEYVHFFASVMATCYVDVVISGDIEQSTQSEDNLLKRVLDEYAASPDGESLPTFRGFKVEVKCGDQVRRFNQHLLDFRNAIMGTFEKHPLLKDVTLVAAQDVTHVRGEYLVDVVPVTDKFSFDPNTVDETIDRVMDHVRRDVQRYCLLPSDLLFVAPSVKNNPIVDRLNTELNEFWVERLNSQEHRAALHVPYEGETPGAFEKRQQTFAAMERHFDTLGADYIPWYCMVHRHEEGKSIDLSTSDEISRIVSIQTSQGDGRRFVYVVSLSEQALTNHTNGKTATEKYKSLLNVALSRMKEALRVFVQATYDDVWERFRPYMGMDQQHRAAPRLVASPVLHLDGAADTIMDDALFGAVRERVAASTTDTPSVDNPVVDYVHHVIRMATAHTVFWAHLVCQQALEGQEREQVLTIFRKVARAKIHSVTKKEYYDCMWAMRDEQKPSKESIIPVMRYNDNRPAFEDVHRRCLILLRTVQDHVKRWVCGEWTDLRELTPEHAVLLQYAVEVHKLNVFADVKTDLIYEVVRAHMERWDEHESRLQEHYQYLTHLHCLFDKVNRNQYSAADGPPQWKIYRTISLGNKRTKGPTQHFDLKTRINFLVVSEKYAMPVVLLPKVDQMNEYALRLCPRPHQYARMRATQPEGSRGRSRHPDVAIRP